MVINMAETCLFCRCSEALNAGTVALLDNQTLDDSRINLRWSGVETVLFTDCGLTPIEAGRNFAHSVPDSIPK